jgi:putative spermidine/putrescine transport system ATP-binding protein
MDMSRQPKTGMPINDGQGASAGLRLAALGKNFGAFTAVRGIDLHIRRGEFLTLLGPSGSGKTTLLMMIAGFLDPSFGEILLDGRQITRLAPEKRNFGMVFQGYALFPHMTVRQNIAYPLEVRRKPVAEVNARVGEMLELVQLGQFADRLPRQLSGGQQQRVALARALSFGPEILLLDEPLGALDKKLRGEVQAELKAIHRKVGTTFIYVTHDQEEALSMSDRVVIMNHGEVVQVGVPAELYERPATVFAADFLGKSNFLRATVVEARTSDMTCAIAGHRFRQSAPSHRLATGTAVTLALRPEKITVSELRDAADTNVLPGQVASVTYLGSVLEVEIETEVAGRLVAQLYAWRNSTSLEPGQPVQLEWPADAAVVVSEDQA